MDAASAKKKREATPRQGNVANDRHRRRAANTKCEPPDGRLRHSQAITTFGPGALVDLVDDAVVIGGLEYWWGLDAEDEKALNEPRLAEAIDARRPDGRKLNPEAPFRRPPTGKDDAADKRCGIKALVFPRWFVCKNPDCRALFKVKATDKDHRHACASGKPTVATPVRFVMACYNGHLQEFHWGKFVHRGPLCSSAALTLDEGKTGDFHEIEVACVCGVTRPLREAKADPINPPCGGERPWLGPDAKQDCELNLQLTNRTASNVYFSQTMSALSIAREESKLRELIRRDWDRGFKKITKENIDAARQFYDFLNAALSTHSREEILKTIEEINNNQGADKTPLRTAEFLVLDKQPFQEHRDQPIPPRCKTGPLFARQIPSPPGRPEIAKVLLAHRLRMVQAQVGFTRLDAPSANLQGEFDLKIGTQELGLHADWLPAVEIWGEGIFLKLDESAVRDWERRPAVKKREQMLKSGFDAWVAKMQRPPEFPGIRYYLLHSLSHLLLTAISLECGYAASAIQERIYCAPAHGAPNDVPMAAILLMTGTPGSEGTLGGLVGQGYALGRHLRKALEHGRLCSNDPVCASHTPDSDKSERFLEGAACHGCLHMAECSCERFNHYLDRSLVVPTMGTDEATAKALAFFSVETEKK